MKKLSETLRIAREALIAIPMVVAAVSSYGRTVSVSSMARDSEGRLTANLTLSDGDTAVLYVAYGATHGGSDFDAWDTRHSVGIVDGSTTSYAYTFPSDMGDDVAAVRFFLLEDYDIPLTKRYAYIETDGSQYVETSFVPTGHSAVEMQLSLNKVDSSVALCCARTDNPNSFTVFYITGSGWRFDYYNVASAVGPVAEVNKPYALRLERNGIYLDGTCLSSRTPVSKVSGRSLLLFGAKNGNEPLNAEYKASMKLYSMKAWSNSTDQTSIALDLVPTEHNGEACLYNKIDGTFLKSARSGHPLAHGAEVSVNRPEVISSSDSLNVSGTWYVDCVNGNDANPGTSALPKQTIRAATKNAVSGDVIYVAPGTYGALEGFQTWPAGSEIGSRVVIPEGVTLESTGRAENTFIVGAASQSTVVTEGWLAGVGPGAVRCVVAGDGATLRGFTLTGGYTHGSNAQLSKDRSSAAFMTVSTARTATIEDCIVSNNVSARYTINMAVVRRCRVIGNMAGSSTQNTLSGSAGFGCYWYGSVIAGNKGNATVYNSLAIENCTVGYGNVYDPAGNSAQAMFWDTSADRSMVNSAILAGRFKCAKGYRVCCTNCLVFDSDHFNSDLKSWSYKTIVTNAAAMQVDPESYRPILGSFVGIDRGDMTGSSDMLGDKDIYGTPRILNAALDIGAVEYDWRTTFAAELGRRFTMTYASPTVTTNGTGGLKLDGNVGTLGERALPVCIAGTATSAGPYAFTFDLSGGSAAVYVGGALAGEASGTGEQSIRFNVPDAAAEIRFSFTPDAENPGAAVLRKFAGARGFSMTIR